MNNQDIERWAETSKKYGVELILTPIPIYCTLCKSNIFAYDICLNSKDGKHVLKGSKSIKGPKVRVELNAR